MRLLDDPTNRGSDADADYVPGQNARDSYNNSQLGNDDGYQSSNQYGDQNPKVKEQSAQAEKNPSDGGFGGKVKRAMQRAQDSASALKALGDDSPENREKVKEEAKERIRKYTKDKLEDKLGKEAGKFVGKGIKQAGKEAVKDVGKNIGKQVGKQVGKEAVRLGAQATARTAAEVATKAAETGLTAAGPETLGLGFLAAILLEIAMDLSLGDAIDCMFELGAAAKAAARADMAAANEHRKQAKWHAQKAYMSIAMFIWLIIAVGMSISLLGWIIGLPLMLWINVYMLLGIFFPKIGWFQGLSRWWERAFIIIFDFVVFVIMMGFIAGLFWWICQQSGLGTGLFATIGAKLADWWSGTDFISTFNDVCTQLGQF